MDKKKAIIIDDNEGMRETLRVLLMQGRDIEIAGEASDGKQGVELAKAVRPDLVIIDIAMPVMNGIDATKLIREKLPEARIIGLTMYTNKHFAESMLSAGATAVISKDMLFQEIMFAIGSGNLDPVRSSVSQLSVSIGR